MDLNQYLTEVILTGDNELNIFFDDTLKKVFSPSYYNKIESTLQNKINLSYYNNPNDRAASFVKPGDNKHIYINKYFFDKYSREKKMEFLVHEFFHILQQSKSFLFQKKFKEIIDLDKTLEKIAIPYLKGSFTSFLTGQSNETIDSDCEMLSYIVGNRSADWNRIDLRGKKLIQNTIENSGFFNTHSDYWKKVF